MPVHTEDDLRAAMPTRRIPEGIFRSTDRDFGTVQNISVEVKRMSRWGHAMRNHWSETLANALNKAHHHLVHRYDVRAHHVVVLVRNDAAARFAARVGQRLFDEQVHADGSECVFVGHNVRFHFFVAPPEVF